MRSAHCNLCNFRAGFDQDGFGLIFRQKESFFEKKLVNVKITVVSVNIVFFLTPLTTTRNREEVCCDKKLKLDEIGLPAMDDDLYFALLFCTYSGSCKNETFHSQNGNGMKTHSINTHSHSVPFHPFHPFNSIPHSAQNQTEELVEIPIEAPQMLLEESEKNENRINIFLKLSKLRVVRNKYIKKKRTVIINSQLIKRIFFSLKNPTIKTI
ncbi:hypothetical protein BpHYR1_018629 [Brachionus plicatilis]|uniref:Uncharacterized protein n=1 Tax=Brachionus plicatilis TaxID=10195 RepID=A0A3M7RUL5_BRAPC|nr:hypothetical protein BpHYR1_018629 [Brachionus plicatilis]